MRTDDTIAAVSSAVGTAARMIVRTSGQPVRSRKAIAADTLPAGRTQLSFTGIVLPATLYSFRARAPPATTSSNSTFPAIRYSHACCSTN